MGLMTLAEAAAKFAAVAIEVNLAEHAIVEQACKMISDTAKDALGTYIFGWAPLAESTVARKARGDSPLLETGELRDSIHYTVRGNSGEVGSDLDKAVWMELGTKSIPPRPFLSSAARDREREIQAMAGRAVYAVIAGKGMGSSEVEHLIHALKTVKHAAHDMYESLGRDDSGN